MILFSIWFKSFIKGYLKGRASGSIEYSISYDVTDWVYKLSIIFNHCTIMIVMSFWCSFRLLSIAKKKTCILYIICSTKSVVEFVYYLTDVLSLYFHLSLDLISKIWVGWEWFRKIQNSFPFVSALTLTTMVLGIKKKLAEDASG